MVFGCSSNCDWTICPLQLNLICLGWDPPCFYCSSNEPCAEHSPSPPSLKSGKTGSFDDVAANGPIVLATDVRLV